MQERDKPKPEGLLSETRNSKLREVTAGSVEKIAERLHQYFPHLSPTHLNILGVIGVGIGSYIASSRDIESPSENTRKTINAGGIMIPSILLDAIDGQLARTIDAATNAKIKVNMKMGQIYDILVDRSEEFIMAYSRFKQAWKRGDKVGGTLALLSGVTSALPGIARANAEENGTAVPEVGKGFFPMVGSRPARASLGIAATLFPEIKGVPTQVITDAVLTVGNITNTVDRYKRSKNSLEPTLPREKRKLGEERLDALVLFEGIVLGVALVTYLDGLKGQKIQPQTVEKRKLEHENDYYQETLARIERYCKEHGLDHRFVGGALTDLIGPQTSYAIDIQNRSVLLENPNNIRMARSDGSIKDIDLIMFTSDQQAFKAAQKEFSKWAEEAKAKGLPVPNISAEAARYPDWPARNKLKQFVSAFEVDDNGALHLTFGKISQKIPWETIKSWQVKLPDGSSITTLHPFAHALCYMLRVPSGVKRKDKAISIDPESQRKYSKVNLLMHLARATREQGGQEEWDRYSDWVTYIQNIHLHPDPITRFKGIVTGTYWDTIGTQVSHGVGLFGSLSTLSDKMSG